MGNNILIIPCCEKGKGSGHFMRCIRLVSDLRALNSNARIYLPHDFNVPESVNFNIEWQADDQFKPDLIILDRFKTPLNELKKWKKISPVIGIDEGGKYRDKMDFLIDVLIPKDFIKPAANTASAALIKFLPVSVKKQTNNKKIKILIAFGQEDSAGLGIKTAKILSKKNIDNAEITLLSGALKDSHSAPQDLKKIKVLHAIPGLAEHLNEYDLVITHYGLTAYEAVFSGTALLLAHPSFLHKKLAKAAGFLSFSKYIKILLKNRKDIHAQIIKIQEHYDKIAADLKLDSKETSLSGLINSLSVQVSLHCPVCGRETPEHSIARFYERTYRRCRNCANIYMDRTFPPAIEYEREYFFESYKKQYGKTYIEDFPNLTALAEKRLKNIKSLLNKTALESLNGENPAILDIGCAYGPFLYAAKKEGFSPYGIDPAKDAVSYVQTQMGIPAAEGYFPGCSSSFLKPHFFNAVTLWYVIEHFRDCVPVFTEIKKLLKQGGLLAFSTPSFTGISGRSSLKDFLFKSPADHYTIWSPSACRKALALCGFKVKKIVINGHHPERFPLLGKFAKNKTGVVYCLLSAISRLLKTGDTFEVYAEAI